MTILPRIDVSVRSGDATAAGLDLDIGGGRAGVGLDVSTPVVGLSVDIGLDRLLNSYSPVDHLLNGPDALARFRAGAVPADPAPVAERGMSIRVGDPDAPVATHYAVSVGVPGVVAARADLGVRLDGNVAARAEAGADTRGVTTVRDTPAAATLPQRVDAPGGATVAQRGIAVMPQGVQAGTGPAFALAPGALLAGQSVSVPFVGFVDLLAPGLDGRATGIATAHDAPPGAVLAYQRSDGATVVELRTATGYAGLTAASPTPLSQVRADVAYVLAGVFVADAVVPPPDGRDMPAGQPAPPGDRSPSFGTYAGSDATDRPYLHAIWYDILARRFAEAGVDLQARSAVLRDAVWATALEHGPFAAADGGDVFSRLQRTLDLPRTGDAEIVAALFAERARTGPDGSLVHYPDVLPFEQARLVARLADEAAVAAGRIVAE